MVVGTKGLEMRRLSIALLLIGLLGLAPFLPMDGPNPDYDSGNDSLKMIDGPLIQTPPKVDSLRLGAVISFTENLGQLGEGAGRYYAMGDPLSVAFGNRWVAYRLRNKLPGEDCLVRVTFPGAHLVEPIGCEPTASKSNYLVSDDPDSWITGARCYSKVRYPDLWDGVDLEYRVQEGCLKYAFTIRPGTSPSVVRMHYEGIERLEIDGPTGGLRITTCAGPLMDDAPQAYNENRTTRTSVSCSFRLFDATTVEFELGRSDPHQPLVIDPGLEFSTYIGTTSSESFPFIAVDGDGCPYICGCTYSPYFPTTPGAFDRTFNGTWNNLFVLKLDANATRLVYSTFIGGGNYDTCSDICVDRDGYVYLTGWTSSTDFPTTPGAYDTTYGGGTRDAFALKLSPDGTDLVYSTLIGGDGWDEGHAICADDSGIAYITGVAGNSSFPTTTGVYDRSWNGGWDAFVLALDANGTSLVFSTFVGGEYWDMGLSLCLDSSGDILVAGNTGSRDFPTTAGAYDTALNDGSPTNLLTDTFVLKMSPDGSAILSATFLGGSRQEYPSVFLDIDAQGRSCIAGYSTSRDFPVTPESYSDNQYFDGYITMLTSDLSRLVFSTRMDVLTSLALDSTGAVLITGDSERAGWATKDSYDPTFNDGGQDAYLMKLEPTGSRVLYSTYFGGRRYDSGIDLAVDDGGHAYLVGTTNSPDLPTSENAYNRTYTNESVYADIFVAKLELVDTNGTVPTEPQNLTEVEGDGEVLIAWENPTDDSWYAILYNEVWRGTEAENLTKLSMVSYYKAYVDKDVINGNVYYYAIRAANIIGRGGFSHTISAIPHRPPGPPETLTATAGMRSISLRWTPPVNTGGPPIKGYSVWRGANGSVLDHLIDVPDILEYTDSYLTPECYYYYMVCAFHIRDAGPFSPLAYAAPFGPPGPPSNLTANTGNASVALAWGPSNATGGKPIEGYRLYRGIGEVPLMLHDLPGLATTYIDRSVENGRTYRYAVLAFNEAGDGPLSGTVSATPAGPPGAPRNARVEEGDSNLTILWDPPSETGGSPVIGYRLYRGMGELYLQRLGEAVGRTTYVDTGLENGRTYYYRVSAWTAAGEGPFTDVIDGLPLGRPSAPDMLIANPGLGYVELIWLAPVDDGGSIIAGYRVYKGTGAGDLEPVEKLGGGVTRWKDTDVLAGRTYHYMVSAMNGRNEGEPSSVVDAIPFGIPTAPLNLTAEPGDGKVVLSWAPPSNSGGKPIIGYRIYRAAGSSGMVLVAAGRIGHNFMVSGLENGRGYLFRITAENEAGEGPGTEVPAVPVGCPMAPTSLQATVEGDFIVLTWSEPLSDGGMPVTGFIVRRRTASTQALVLAQLGNVTRYVDGGARAGTTYTYWVSAINAVGIGNTSEPSQANIPSRGPLDVEGAVPIILVIIAVTAATGMAYWFGMRARQKRFEGK